jgi:coenzyme F420-reducing hydrogenase beta subunit
MTETNFGECHPTATEQCPESCRLCCEVCPFSNEPADDEDSLGKEWFGRDAGCSHHAAMGWFRDTFVGGIADAAKRSEAASGGLTSAVLCQLLQRGRIDAAIVLQPTSERPWHRAAIAESELQLLAARGSVYHVTPLDKAISDILTGPEQSYAVVALPCTAKAIRLAQQRMPALRRRIHYVFGLTCSGHRSLQFADLLMALMGRSQGILHYRSKRHARTGLDFRTELTSGESVRTLKMLGMFGYLWINKVGSLRSCLFCDDIFAELADATFMDAWLPEYDVDRRGTSLAISRNPEISEILSTLFDTGQCEGGRIAPERVAQSQSGVVHYRRDLLAARCRVAAETHGYVPRKRLSICPPSSGEADDRRARQEMAYFHAVRRALRRFHQRSFQKPAWLAQWHAWRFCAGVLWLATRYGFLGTLWQGTKFLPRKWK